MEIVKEPVLFSCPDYRDYVRDHYRHRRARNKTYSLSTIARKVNQSKMSIKYLIDKKHHIAEEHILALAEALSLEGEERQYFCSLVRFNKAKSLPEKNRHFQKMVSVASSSLGETLVEQSELGYFRRWFYPVIAEMSYLESFQATPEWIRARLTPTPPMEEVRQALAYLQEHGYMRGGQKSEKKTKVPDHFRSHQYKSYVAELMDVSRRALENPRAAELESFNITISVDEQRYQLAKQMISEFRHQLHNTLANHETCGRVIQINLQMFTAASVSSPGEKK